MSPLRREDGFTMATAMLVLMILLLLSAAALSGTLSARGQASRATSNAKALEAAEAAANFGEMRANLAQIDKIAITNPLAVCLKLNADGTLGTQSTFDITTTVPQWCPSIAVAVPGASSASFRISQIISVNINGTVKNERYILGTATVAGVTRRVRLTLVASQNTAGASSSDPFDGYGVISLADFDMPNQTLVSGAGVRSNGNITFHDTAVACHVPNGSVTPGPGKSYTGFNSPGLCGQSTAPATSAATLPAQTVPATFPDDALICPVAALCNDVTWNLAAKTLTMQNSASITLTGNAYAFCFLDLKAQSVIHVNPTNHQPVKFYFPAGCGSGQRMWLENQSKIDNLTGLGAKGIQFYFADVNTTALIDNSNQTNAMFYGPGTTFSLINQANVKGGIAGAGVTMTASAKVVYDGSIKGIIGGGGGGLTNLFYPYGQTNYSQCAGTATSDPNAGC